MDTSKVDKVAEQEAARHKRYDPGNDPWLFARQAVVDTAVRVQEASRELNAARRDGTRKVKMPGE